MFTSPVLGFVIAFAFILAIYWIFRALEAQADGAPLPPPPGLLGRRSWPSPTARTMPRRRWASSPWPSSRPASSRSVDRAVVGHRRVGDGAVAGDRGRWLADHEDDGPARRQARAGPRLRGRDDGRLDPVRDRPLRACRSRPPRSSPARSWASARARASAGVRWGVARRILVAWVLTIPAAGILAALAWVVLNALGAP